MGSRALALPRALVPASASRARYSFPALLPRALAPSPARARLASRAQGSNTLSPNPKFQIPQSYPNLCDHESTSAAILKLQASQGRAGLGRARVLPPPSLVLRSLVLPPLLLMDLVGSPVNPPPRQHKRLQHLEVFNPPVFLRGQVHLRWAQVKDSGDLR